MLDDITQGGEEASSVPGDAGGRFDSCERLENVGHARRVLGAEVVVGDGAVDGGGLRVGEAHVVDDGCRGRVVVFHAGTVSRSGRSAQVAYGAFRLVTHEASGNYAP